MAEISISRVLAHWLEELGDNVAVTIGEQTATWRQLEERSNQLARSFTEAGVSQDDFVTIGLPNSIEFIVSTFAVWKLGATPLPVSSALPVYERNQIIELAKPKLVLGFAGEEISSIPCLPVDFAPHRTLDSAPLPIASATRWKAMTSGGSTGRPKLIVSTDPAVTDPDAGAIGLMPRGSVLVPGPLYHNGPFAYAFWGLFLGNHVCITEKFDAEETLMQIEKHRADLLYLVPTMMHRIWNLPEATRKQYDLSSIRNIWHMAAPCPGWLKQHFIDWFGGDVIWELYGGTEGQATTQISGTEWLDHRGSVGKPTEVSEVKVVGKEGTTLPPGEIGEIYLRPVDPNRQTYRYIGAEASRLENRWESLGDLGYLDEQGYLYISDRKTDMIVSGGANIYPAEIEAAIEMVPGVRSCAVIGLPHDDLGNVVHAIVDSGGSTLSEEDILTHLRERLVRYKIPRSLEFTNETLRNDAGKLRRSALRADRVDTAR